MHAGSWPAQGLVVFLLGVSTLTLVQPSEVDVGLEGYDDVLLQSLYKRLSEIDSQYFVDAVDEARDAYRQARDDESSILGSDSSAAAIIRDSEHIQHSSHAGVQHDHGDSDNLEDHLTLGNAVSSLKAADMKTDKALPAYCHPTNPCPKGFTSDDGCQEDVSDTAEAQKAWISALQDSGECTCDREHMFDCPDSKPAGDNSGINSVVDNLLSDKAAATYMSGEERQTLVAKKSPRFKRSLSKNNIERELKVVSETSRKRNNPYLSGEKLRRVAKKG